MSGSARRILLVAGLTWREAARRKLLIAIIAMSASFLALYGYALHVGEASLWGSVGPGMGAAATREMMAKLVSAQLLYMGLFPTSFLIALTAVFISVGSISNDVESGVMYGMLSLPLSRTELVLGKFLGLGAMLVAYAAAFDGSVVAIARWQAHAPLLSSWPVGLLLLTLESVPLLALSLLGSTRLPTLANGIMCAAAYGVAFLGGLIEAIGAVVQSATMGNIGIVSSLIMPLDAVHRLALSLLLPQGLLFQNGGPTGIGGGTVPSVWMVVYAAVYVVVLAAWAARVFGRRDL